MNIKKVGVVGCGLMGAGIAQVAAQAGYDTIVRELNEELLEKGLGRISAFLDKRVAKKKLTQARRNATWARISGTTDLADLADCDLVIEVIFENMQALNRQGLTILYTTHYMEEAELLCDRVAIMDEGQIIALDTPQNLINTLGAGIIHIGIKDVAEEMLTRLRALPQVKAVARRDNTLAFETVDAQRALLEIIGLFNETDTPMTSLEILEPNLESVFIQLTGKQLRGA